MYHVKIDQTTYLLKEHQLGCLLYRTSVNTIHSIESLFQKFEPRTIGYTGYPLKKQRMNNYAIELF
jgi:hypothetical protein